MVSGGGKVAGAGSGLMFTGGNPKACGGAVGADGAISIGNQVGLVAAVRGGAAGVGLVRAVGSGAPQAMQK
jgi:hypothetical protein